MKTLILPGYSPRNKEWAEDLAKSMNLGHKIFVHNWRHWEKGGSLSLKYEVEKVLEEVGDGMANIIAKSVGTAVIMYVLPKISKAWPASPVKAQVNKIILCGVASVNDERIGKAKKALEGVDPKKVIVFQNTSDPLASFIEVKKFIEKVDAKIKVVETPRGDHNYPFPEKFEEFLK